jgi:hypothetical protein
VADVENELRLNNDAFGGIFTNAFARLKHFYSSIAVPVIFRAAQTTVRNETHRRLTVTAIALERHRLHHGKFPGELGALVPEFLSAALIDPMNAKPFGYRTNSDGSFTLYSVGEDGRDDNGDPNPPTTTNRFGLWEGKDAVWPMPLK